MGRRGDTYPRKMFGRINQTTWLPRHHRQGMLSRMKRRKSSRGRAADEGAYVCPTCGERIVVPLDLSQGDEQQYVEDCPVCCNPNVVHVELLGEGERPRVWAEPE